MDSAVPIPLLLPLALSFMVGVTLGIISSSVSVKHPHLTNATDQAALLSFKTYITHDPNGVLASWNTNRSTSCCNWYGVSCSPSKQRVTALVLNDTSLEGRLSPHISNLSFLAVLSLTNNSFQGHLPQEFGHLIRLKRLYLSNNQLQGTIPSSLGQCQQLQALILAFNKFTGTIPRELGGLPQLRMLILGQNRLTGTIPPFLGNLSKLEKIDMGKNILTGSIPHEMGQLFSLQFLRLVENSLTGLVPPSFYNKSSLQNLDLGQNSLSGILPADVLLPDPQQIYLSDNQFSGLIPISLTNASNLGILEMSKNSFSGPIPLELGKLSHLRILNLMNNELVNAPNAVELDFLTSLTNCSALTNLIIAYNPLSGVLPTSIGKLSNQLERFYAHSCQIYGRIPKEIGNLTSLLQLLLLDNSLSGVIPATIGGLGRLQFLELSHNLITGSVPAELFRVQSLGLLLLDNNMISGSLSDSIGNLTHLQKFSLSFNRISSDIPSSLWGIKVMLSLKMSDNKLTGTLPTEVGNLKALTLLDLSANKMTGSLPSSLSELQMLSNLNLSWNSFKGSIPESFGKLISIESIDLSLNSLDGEIPSSLQHPPHLMYLNLSFNRLEGEIPSGGAFTNLSSRSFLGNHALCGAARFQVPACTKRMSKKKKTSHKAIILIITLPLFFIMCALSITLFLKRKTGHHFVDEDEMLGRGHMMISHYDLVRATNNFSEANLLGAGSFGSVYKGILVDGTCIAVKVINSSSAKASSTFDAECQILRRIRHRNLVKVITACSNHDFKALVLQFMPNGSLEKWLYSQNNFLSLHQRLGIMIDVACAMEYLHHGYTEPIVHCDLKPSNVLLDHDMVGHVCDFGIAKLLIEKKTSTHTITLGTIGYIAPEYGLVGKVSIKCDVFSYGVMLLETFTKKRPTDAMFGGGFSLRKRVDEAFPHAINDVVDNQLLSECSVGHNQNVDPNMMLQVLMSIIEVGLVCSAESPEKRMDMTSVVARLKRISSYLLAGRVIRLGN